MGTLGKILLVGNLFLAAGVVYAAATDWAARKNLQTNAVRHHLLVAGLPVTSPGTSTDADLVPLRLAMPGLNRMDSVFKKTFDAHFSGVTGDDIGGSGPVRSQIEELTTVKTKLDARLGGSPAEVVEILCGKFVADANDRSRYTPGVLANMAESFSERELIRRLADANITPVGQAAEAARNFLDRKFAAASKIDAQAADADATRIAELTDALKKASDSAQTAFLRYEDAIRNTGTSDADRAAVDAAVQEAETAARRLREAQSNLDTAFADAGQSASRDALDQARRVAHLLVHASDAVGWQKRAAHVVGLRAYADAINTHATRVRRMAASADQQITQDQAQFSSEYDTLRTLAAGRAVLLAQQTNIRAGLEVERSNDTEAVTQRRLLLVARRETLRQVQAEVEAALTSQGQVQKQLFETQKQVAETLRRNAELEDRLTLSETTPSGR